MDALATQNRKIAIDSVIDLYAAGLVGFVESRSLIAAVWDDFAEVRDATLDVEVTEDEQNV